MAKEIPALAGRRVLALSSFDSFLKAAACLGDVLTRYGATVDHGCVYLRAGQLSLEQCQNAGIDALPPLGSAEEFADPKRIGKYDIVILALDNQRTRDFTAALFLHYPYPSSRPVTTTLFPGLIFRSHFDSFSSRASCDLVLLNSPNDCELYKSMATALELSNNSQLFGLPLLAQFDAIEHNATGDSFLYVDQPTVPGNLPERTYILERLIELANRFPDRQVFLKPRHRPDESTLHRTQHHFADIYANRQAQDDIPDNLLLRYGSMTDALNEAGVVITVSSTAALEAIARGIPTRILTDLGIHEQSGNHFFLGSGLLASFDEIQPNLDVHVDETWLRKHLARPQDTEESIVRRLRDLLQNPSKRTVTAQRLFGRSERANAYILQQFGTSAVAQIGQPAPPPRSVRQRFVSALSRALRLR